MTKKKSNNEECCKKCDRSTAMIAKQQSDPALLPYLTCKSCKAPMYYERDTEYVEQDGGDIAGIRIPLISHNGIRIPLISHCFNKSWEAALQRVRIYPKEADSHSGDYKSTTALFWVVYLEAPIEVIREIAAAGPSMVVFEDCWNDLGLPLDILLRNHYTIKPDLTSKVMAILKGNMSAAALSVHAAWLCQHHAVVLDGKVLEDTRDEKQRKDTTLTCQEQALLLWDIFSFLNKVAYYKTLDCTHLPLLHALADFPFFYRDQDGLNWSQCPSKALEAAIRMYPEELLKPDAKGNLPLHLAAKRDEPYREKEDDESECGEEWTDPYDGYNIDKIKILAKACPEASKVKNSDGDLPLHLAMKARKSWAGILAIFDAYPDAVDKAGNTGLHLAAMSELPYMQDTIVWHDSAEDEHFFLEGDWENHCHSEKSATDISLIERLVDANPTGLQTRNRQGSLPLLLGIKSGKSWDEGIQTMLEAYTDAAQEPDAETGLLPFMLAALHGDEEKTAVELTYRLLLEFPAALENCLGESVTEIVLDGENSKKKQKVTGQKK
jgi:ankyrin repeat protein